MSEDRSQRFDGLFTAYAPDIVAYCGWRAASASDAQDAVADVFLTAWRRLDAVPEGDAARVWLYVTARRVLANQRRSRRRHVALQERLAAEPPAGASEPPDSAQTRGQVLHCRVSANEAEQLVPRERPAGKSWHVHGAPRQAVLERNALLQDLTPGGR